MILITGGAILLAMYVLGVFDDDPITPPPAGVWDACSKGDLVSSITVSTASGEVEILEEAGPLAATPWLEYPEVSWDLAYEDSYTYGPVGPALEARLIGEPEARVCFRIDGEPAGRQAGLVATEEAANVSMQWVMILAGSDDTALADTRTDYPWVGIQAAVGEDGKLFARWRGGSNGTSATYSLVRLEILVEWGRTLEAG